MSSNSEIVKSKSKSIGRKSKSKFTGVKSKSESQITGLESDSSPSPGLEYYISDLGLRQQRTKMYKKNRYLWL